MRNKIFNGDNRKLIKSIDTNSVDFIFTDLNKNKYSNGGIRLKHRSDINNDIAKWDYGFNPNDYKEDFLRVLKPTENLFTFTSYNMMERWHEIFDPMFDTF